MTATQMAMPRAKDLFGEHIRKAAGGDAEITVKVPGDPACDKGWILHGTAEFSVPEGRETARKGDLMVLMQEKLDGFGWNATVAGEADTSKPGWIKLDCVAERWPGKAGAWLKAA